MHCWLDSLENSNIKKSNPIKSKVIITEQFANNIVLGEHFSRQLAICHLGNGLYRWIQLTVIQKF